MKGYGGGAANANKYNGGVDTSEQLNNILFDNSEQGESLNESRAKLQQQRGGGNGGEYIQNNLTKQSLRSNQQVFSSNNERNSQQQQQHVNVSGKLQHQYHQQQQQHHHQQQYQQQQQPHQVQHQQQHQQHKQHQLQQQRQQQFNQFDDSQLSDDYDQLQQQQQQQHVMHRSQLGYTQQQQQLLQTGQRGQTQQYPSSQNLHHRETSPQEVDQEIVNVLNNIECPFNDFSMSSNSNSSTPHKHDLNEGRRNFQRHQQQKLHEGDDDIYVEDLHRQPNHQRQTTFVDESADLSLHHRQQGEEEEEEEEGEREGEFDQFDKSEGFQEEECYDDIQQAYPPPPLPSRGGKIDHSTKNTSVFPEINVPTMELSNENSAIFSQYMHQRQQPTFAQKQQTLMQENQSRLEQQQNDLRQIYSQHFDASPTVATMPVSNVSTANAGRGNFNTSAIQQQPFRRLEEFEDQADFEEDTIDHVPASGSENFQQRRVQRSGEDGGTQYLEVSRRNQFPPPQNNNEDISGYMEEDDDGGDAAAADHNDEGQSVYDEMISHQEGQNVEGDAGVLTAEQEKVRASKQRINQIIAEEDQGNLHKNIADKAKLIGSLQHEKSVLYQRLSEAEERSAFLTEKFKDSSSLEVLRGRSLDQAQKQLSRLRGVLEEKERSAGDLSEQVDGLSSYVAQLESAFENELSSLFSEVEKQRVINGSYVAKLSEYENTFEELNRQRKHTAAETASRTNRLEQELMNLHKQGKQKDEQREVDARRLLERQAEIDRLFAVVKAMESEERTSTEKHARLRDQLEVVMARNANTNNLNDNSATADGDQSLQLQSPAAAAVAATAFSAEISRVKLAYDRQIARLNQEIAAMKEERITVNTAVATREHVEDDGTNAANKQDELMKLLEGGGITINEVMDSHIQLHNNLQQQKKRGESEERVVNIEYLSNSSPYHQSRQSLERNNYNNIAWERVAGDILRQKIMEYNLVDEFPSLMEDEHQEMLGGDNDLTDNVIDIFVYQVANLRGELRNEIECLSEDLQSRINQLMQECNTLRIEKENAVAMATTTATGKSATAVNQLTNTVRNLEDTVRVLERSKVQAAGEITELKTVIDEFRNNNEFLEQQLEEIQRENEYLGSELQAAVKSVSSQLQGGDHTSIPTPAPAAGEVESMRRAFQDHVNMVELQLNGKLTDMTEKMNRKNHEVTELSIEKQSLVDECEELKQRIVEERRATADGSNVEEVEKLRVALKQQQQTCSELSLEVSALQQQMKAEKAEKQRLSNQLAAQTSCLKLVDKEKNLLLDEKEETAGITKECETLKVDLKLKEEELKRILNAAKKNEENLRAQISEISAKAEKATATAEKARVSAERLEEQLNEVESARRELSLKIDSSQQHAIILKSKEEYVKTLEEKVQVLTKQVRDKDKKNIELFQQQKQLGDAQKKAESVMASANEELEKSKKQLTLKSVDMKQITAKYQESQKNMQDMANCLQQLEARNESLAEHAKTLQRLNTQKDPENTLSVREFDEMKVFFQVKCEDLLAQLSVLSQRCSHLEQENSSLVREVEELNAVNDALSTKLEEFATLNNRLGSQVAEREKKLKDLNATKQKRLQEVDQLNSHRTLENFDGEQYNHRQIGDHTRQDSGSKRKGQGGMSNNSTAVTGFSPEMLSAEETIALMLDVLRRTTKSSEMTRILANSDEFLDLIDQVHLLNSSSGGGNSNSNGNQSFYDAQSEQRSLSSMSSAAKLHNNNSILSINQKTVPIASYHHQQQPQQFHLKQQYGRHHLSNDNHHMSLSQLGYHNNTASVTQNYPIQQNSVNKFNQNTSNYGSNQSTQYIQQNPITAYQTKQQQQRRNGQY